jgi:AraC family transcriptional regulator of adaptative response / DNA-3-methyladenine glycosylase II
MQGAPLPLSADECHRAVDARDPQFDGVFFVAIRSTKIYCRPVCPSRQAKRENRRFFATTCEAEQAGFRSCLRCRPDLVPGSAPADASRRLARVATERIAAGALDGARVTELARELGVSERQLRRSVARVAGAAPKQLAVARRLERARQLVVETNLPVTRIAFDSEFGSLRRFNDAFRSRYGVAPSTLRNSLPRV